MDILTLKSDIQNKDIKSFYIFSGDEVAVQRIYIHKLAEISGVRLEYVDEVSSIYFALTNRSFMTEKYCYVVIDDKEFMQNEKLQNRIESLPKNGTILILLLTSVDKRTKFYKKYADRIIEFKPLSDTLLIKYIQKDINIKTQYCEELISRCNGNYSRILLEIDKVKNFATAENINDNEAVQRLLDKVIYKEAKDVLFDFTDAVLNRNNVDRIFSLMDESYDAGEATFVMLTALYNNVKAVLQVQECTNKDISKSTGLTAWQIKNAKRFIGRYATEELRNFLKLIKKIESGIKKGRIEEQNAIEFLLVSVL